MHIDNRIEDLPNVYRASNSCGIVVELRKAVDWIPFDDLPSDDLTSFKF
jgi:hypothetical protein